MATTRHALRPALAAAAAIVILLTGCGSSSDDEPAADGATAVVEQKIDAEQAKSRAAPTDPEPHGALAKLRFQAATLKKGPNGEYTAEGKAELRRATQAWERYLALNPQPVDSGLAQLMAAAYGPGSLDDPKQALAAQQIVTENADPVDGALYAQLAQMAYSAGETQTGDRAAARAIELTPRSERSVMREAMRSAKAQLAEP